MYKSAICYESGEIIEGVKPGEKLVTEGKNLLVNGAPVNTVRISRFALSVWVWGVWEIGS